MRVAIVLGLAVCVSALPFSTRTDVSDFSNNGLSNNQDYKEVLKQADEYLDEQLAEGKVSQDFVDKINQQLDGTENLRERERSAYLDDTNQQLGGTENPRERERSAYHDDPDPSYASYRPNRNNFANHLTNDAIRLTHLRKVLQFLYQPHYGVSPSTIQYLIQKYESALFIHQLNQLDKNQGQGGFGGPYFNPYLLGNPFYGPLNYSPFTYYPY